MPKLVIDEKCEEEIEGIEEDFPDLYENVQEDLEYLEQFGFETTVPGSNLPPETSTLTSGKYDGKIKYIRSNHGNDIFRVYFFLIGDFVVCLLGWVKKQDDIPNRILTNIESRCEKWIDYSRS